MPRHGGERSGMETGDVKHMFHHRGKMVMEQRRENDV